MLSLLLEIVVEGVGSNCCLGRVISTLFSFLGPTPALGWMEGQVTVSSLGALVLVILIHVEFFSVGTASLGSMGLSILGPLIFLFLLMGWLTILIFFMRLPVLSVAVLLIFMGFPAPCLMALFLFMGLPVPCLTWSFLTLMTMSTTDLVTLLFLSLVALSLTMTLLSLGLSVSLPITPFVRVWPFLLNLCYKFVLVVLAILLRLPCLVTVLLL